MKISYSVCCSTETNTLRNLLIRLINSKSAEDEIIIIYDEDKKNAATDAVIEECLSYQKIKYHMDHNLLPLTIQSAYGKVLVVIDENKQMHKMPIMNE